jgi:hypothetical protein
VQLGVLIRLDFWRSDPKDQRAVPSRTAGYIKMVAGRAHNTARRTEDSRDRAQIVSMP